MDDLIPGTGKYGSVKILDRPAAVVLNSRQTKTPRGDDPWVINTIAAVNHAAESGFPIIVSVGMNTWEIALYAACQAQCPVVVLISKEKDRSTDEIAASITRDFNLLPENIIWMPLEINPGDRSRKGWWRKRDDLALSLAERIYPVSIRPAGNWDEFLESKDAGGKEIITDFRVDYPKRAKSIPIFPAKFDIAKVRPWPYITHWTRRSYTPWPGETSCEFYRDIVNSRGTYARSASAALMRILEEKRIRASTERIRDGGKAVAFTALPPDEAAQLMKWRRRLVRPTFEPYGISISVKAARNAGIRPVEYLPDGLESHATPKSLQQGIGDGLWPAEAEWRALEDVDLSQFARDDIRILVPTVDEASLFKSTTGFDASALEDLTGF